MQYICNRFQNNDCDGKKPFDDSPYAADCCPLAHPHSHLKTGQMTTCKVINDDVCCVEFFEIGIDLKISKKEVEI